MDNAFLSQAVRELTGEHMTPAYIEHKLALAGLTPAPEPNHPTEALGDPPTDGGMSIKEALEIAQRLKDQLAGKGLDPGKLATYQAVEALARIIEYMQRKLAERK